jgi:hypothetical protein
MKAANREKGNGYFLSGISLSLSSSTLSRDNYFPYDFGFPAIIG